MAIRKEKARIDYDSVEAIFGVVVRKKLEAMKLSDVQRSELVRDCILELYGEGVGSGFLKTIFFDVAAVNQEKLLAENKIKREVGRGDA